MSIEEVVELTRCSRCTYVELMKPVLQCGCLAGAACLSIRCDWYIIPDPGHTEECNLRRAVS